MQTKNKMRNRKYRS